MDFKYFIKVSHYSLIIKKVKHLKNISKLISKRARLLRQYENYLKLRKSNFMQNIPSSAFQRDVELWDSFMCQIRDEILAVDLEIARFMTDLE